MNNNEQKYYVYKHRLGNKNIEISEMDCYESEVLNETNVFIDNHGVYEFCMYSNSKDKIKTFISQISNILLKESEVASHLYHLASGRFIAFEDFRRKLDI